MRRASFFAAGILFVGCTAAAVAGSESAKPTPRFKVQIKPVPPGAPRSARVDRRSNLAQTLPMVIVEKDPSLYPIVVARGKNAEYPIHIAIPPGIAPPTSAAPLNLLTEPRLAQPAKP